MTVGGVDTYYDYDEHQWKFRRLGGRPVHKTAAHPAPESRSVQRESQPVPLSQGSSVPEAGDTRATAADG